MQRIPGLYLTLQNGNKIKRTLVTNNGETDLGETTIGEELIWFAELDYGSYIESASKIEQLSVETESDDPDRFGEVDLDIFDALLTEVNELVYDIEDANLTLGSLLRFALSDNTTKDDGTAMYVYNTKAAICKQVIEPVEFHIVLREILHDIAFKSPINFEEKYADILTADFVQVHTFNGTVETQYRFRSTKSYYQFLLMYFLNSNPNLAWCYCCGQFFIPKTRKETKYCSRIIKDGKTCKQIAPALIHKIEKQNDVVIQAFDRTKQKMYKRFERSLGCLYQLPKGLNRWDYYEWNDAATAARNKYLRGELTAEEALKIIEVKD